MKFLILSIDGDALGIAEQFVRAGHDVRYWIKNPNMRRAGEGLVNRVPSWRPHIGWADLVLADMVGLSSFGKRITPRAKAHLGFTLIADAMELDRQKQMDLLKKVGIRIPGTFQFDNRFDAEDILEMWKPPGYVIKPSGNAPTGKTMVVRDKDTYKWALEQQSSHDELIVQEIVDGVEISTEGWFDGTNWVPGLWNHTLEEKTFLDGGLGPNVGSMGNVVWGIPEPAKDALALEVQKLTPFLRGAEYKGPIDLNAIVSQGKAYALEITARFGYDAIEALSELISPDGLANAIWELASGLKPGARIKGSTFATAVRVCVPPYPFAEPERADAGTPVSIPDDLRSHFYLTDCMLGGNVVQWAAGDGVVCKVTGKGDSPSESSKVAYAHLQKMHVQGMMYRREIGKRAENDLGQLHEWGVL